MLVLELNWIPGVAAPDVKQTSLRHRTDREQRPVRFQPSGTIQHLGPFYALFYTVASEPESEQNKHDPVEAGKRSP